MPLPAIFVHHAATCLPLVADIAMLATLFVAAGLPCCCLPLLPPWLVFADDIYLLTNVATLLNERLSAVFSLVFRLITIIIDIRQAFTTGVVADDAAVLAIAAIRSVRCYHADIIDVQVIIAEQVTTNRRCHMSAVRLFSCPFVGASAALRFRWYQFIITLRHSPCWLLLIPIVDCCYHCHIIMPWLLTLIYCCYIFSLILLPLLLLLLLILLLLLLLPLLLILLLLLLLLILRHYYYYYTRHWYCHYYCCRLLLLYYFSCCHCRHSMRCCLPLSAIAACRYGILVDDTVFQRYCQLIPVFRPAAGAFLFFSPLMSRFTLVAILPMPFHEQNRRHYAIIAITMLSADCRLLPLLAEALIRLLPVSCCWYCFDDSDGYCCCFYYTYTPCWCRLCCFQLFACSFAIAVLLAFLSLLPLFASYWFFDIFIDAIATRYAMKRCPICHSLQRCCHTLYCCHDWYGVVDKALI